MFYNYVIGDDAKSWSTKIPNCHDLLKNGLDKAYRIRLQTFPWKFPYWDMFYFFISWYVINLCVWGSIPGRSGSFLIAWLCRCSDQHLKHRMSRGFPWLVESCWITHTAYHSFTVQISFTVHIYFYFAMFRDSLTLCCYWYKRSNGGSIIIENISE